MKASEGVAGLQMDESVVAMLSSHFHRMTLCKRSSGPRTASAKDLSAST